MSGIKGFFATVTFSTDYNYTDPLTGIKYFATDEGGPKELWSVGSNFVVSSY